MLLIPLAILSVFALTWLIASRCGELAHEDLTEPRRSVPTMGVQIICGNCSGDLETPIKTYLDRVGRCESCGGRSFILASSRGIYAQRLRASRAATADNASMGGRVLAFEVSAHSERTGKIA
jgi:hypothetical protein